MPSSHPELEQPASLFEQALEIALGSLRGPRTGLAALLGMACDASKAALAAVYLIPLEGEPELLTACGSDPEGVARLGDSLEAVRPTLRSIAATPSSGISACAGIGGPWNAHAVSAACACGFAEGTSVLLVAGDTRTNLAAMERCWPAIALLSCASAARDAVTSLRRQLQELRQDRALLAASLQHDLKTPITSVLGAAGMLSGRSGELTHCEQDELLQMIMRQGHRMKDLISSTLSSAVESRETPPMFREVDVHELVRRVAKVALIAREGDVTIEIDDLITCSDSARLERILLNLIDNALKYAPSQTRVHVLGERRAGHVTITVADLGDGVNPAIVPTLFAAYATDPVRSEGTGLGLHSAARIAASLGGGISYSRAGGWTRFTLTLPDSIDLRQAQ